MSAQFKFQNHVEEEIKPRVTVKLTDLLLRMNKEKKRVKKINFCLSAAAISFITVFGIILSS
jgi:hypothetical protein